MNSSGHKNLEVWLDATTGQFLKAIIHSNYYSDKLPQYWEDMPVAVDCGYGNESFMPVSDVERDISPILCNIINNNKMFSDEIIIYRFASIIDSEKKISIFKQNYVTDGIVGPILSVVIRDFPRYEDGDPEKKIIRPTWSRLYTIDAKTGENIGPFHEIMTGERIPENGKKINREDFKPVEGSNN